MKKFKLISILLFFLFLTNSSYSQTTIVLQPGPSEGKDANAWRFDAGINHGDRESITAYAWTHSGDLSNKRSFLEFDLSTIPETAIIQSAHLSLFFNPTDPFESFSVHTGENDIYIQRVTAEWDEHTIVWSNQPSTTSVNQVQLPPSTNPTQNYPNIDVTELIKDMVTSPEGNNGFMIKMVDEVNYYKSVLFASSDHSNPYIRPKLEITYSEENLDCITLHPGPAEGKDAYASSYHASSNTGNHQSLASHTWTNGGNLVKSRIFLGFDFAEIPDNAVVKSAALSLYYNPTDNNQSYDFHTGDNEYYIQRVIDSWDEGIITWNNQPNTTSTNQLRIPPSESPTQDYLDIDVTELVKDMIGSSEGNHGLMIRMVDEINYYRCVLYASSDHSNANLHPKLVVCFETDDEDLLSTASAGSDVSMCFNSSYTLSGTAANGAISWVTSGDGIFTNETTTTPTYTFGSNDISNGSVTLTLIVSGNLNTATDAMIITIKPEAIADAGGDASACYDIPYILSGIASNGTINWSTSGNGAFANENTTTPTYTFGTDELTSGSVTLTITVTGNCNIATDEMLLTLVPHDDLPDFIVSLYPNPASENATIEINQEAEFSMEMFNSLGQLVIEIPSVQSIATFDVSRFAAGNYMIRIVNPEFLFTKKLVIHSGF